MRKSLKRINRREAVEEKHMILRESAVVVPRNQEVAVVGFGESPAEVAKMAAEYSGRPVVVVEVSCGKQVTAEECNVRPEVEAESVLCKVAEEKILALVEVVGIDSDKPVVVVSAVVEVTSNVAAVVVSCNSKELAVGLKIGVATESEEVMEMAAVGSMSAAVVVVMEESVLSTVEVMEDSDLPTVEVMEENILLMAVVMEESNLSTTVVVGESDLSMAVAMEESNQSMAAVMVESDLSMAVVMVESNQLKVVAMVESDLLTVMAMVESDLLMVVVMVESDLSTVVVMEEKTLSTAVVMAESKPEWEEEMVLHPED